MKLKELEIFGFKSFADRTYIRFDEGITVVVGPNGPVNPIYLTLYAGCLAPERQKPSRKQDGRCYLYRF